MDIQNKLDTIRLPRKALQFDDGDALRNRLEAYNHANLEIIGQSRNGQDLLGLRWGHGPRHVAVIAGCHADEPVGPMTAAMLPQIIRDHFPAFLEAFTFHTIPQMNPDGADANSPWFAAPPDIIQYSLQAIREKPGDDIEFGFGEGQDCRPENQAARRFLAEAAPYSAHFSLHGMAYAEGAWFLIEQSWVERAVPIMDGLKEFCERMYFPLHDVERHGEKGFHRIAPGFCTTPVSTAMAAHFNALNDPEMAARFKPTSMEMVQSFGGDPLCMVSELPLFVLGKRSTSLKDNNVAQFKRALDEARALGPEEGPNAISNVAFHYELGPVPIQLQVRSQIAMILLALDHVATSPSH
jgi:hypothetical protein